MTVYNINQSGRNGDNGQNAILRWGSLDYGGSTSARWHWPWFLPISAGAEPSKRIIVTTAANLKNLIVRTLAIPTTVTVTVRVNGVDTALTVTLSSGQTLASNLVNTVSVSIGDRVTIKTVTGAADSSAAYPRFEVELGT